MWISRERREEEIIERNQLQDRLQETLSAHTEALAGMIRAQQSEARMTMLANKTGDELAGLRDAIKGAQKRATVGMTVFCNRCGGVDLRRQPPINGRFRCQDCGALVRDDNRQGMEVTHEVVERFAENRVTAERAAQRARNFESQARQWRDRAMEGEALMQGLVDAQAGHAENYLSSAGIVILNQVKRFLKRMKTWGRAPTPPRNAPPRDEKVIELPPAPGKASQAELKRMLGAIDGEPDVVVEDMPNQHTEGDEPA